MSDLVENHIVGFPTRRLISKTAALTPLIVSIGTSQYILHICQCLCVSNSIEIEQLQICQTFEFQLLRFKALQCIFLKFEETNEN